MVIFEDEEVLSTDEEEQSNTSFDSFDNSTRGVSKEDKRQFLIDLDKHGGVLNVNLERLISLRAKIDGLYGSGLNETTKKRRTKFRNLHFQWRKKYLAGKFESVRREVFNDYPPDVPPPPRAKSTPKAAKPAAKMTTEDDGKTGKYTWQMWHVCG